MNSITQEIYNKDVFLSGTELLLREAEKLHDRHLLAEKIGPDYYEPGMMEYLEQSDSCYNEAERLLTLRFEAKGTRYEGRTEEIERVALGDIILFGRDKSNKFNANNFVLLTRKKRCVGNVPSTLCNAIAPLYDAGILEIVRASVSFVEPLSKRSRYAKQAVLFVESVIKLDL